MNRKAIIVGSYWNEYRRITERHGYHFAGAFHKGYRAALTGEPRRCPYNDDGRTFSTAFARFWNEGWNLGEAEQRNFAQEASEHEQES